MPFSNIDSLLWHLYVTQFRAIKNQTISQSTEFVLLNVNVLFLFDVFTCTFLLWLFVQLKYTNSKCCQNIWKEKYFVFNIFIEIKFYVCFRIVNFIRANNSCIHLLNNLYFTIAVGGITLNCRHWKQRMFSDCNTESCIRGF